MRKISPLKDKSGKAGKIKLSGLINPVIAVIVAVLIAGLLMLASGGNPLTAYAAIVKGAFGSKSALTSTFRYTRPLLLLAISFTISNRCGYFNVGQEGQIYASALVITTVQVLFGDIVPGWLLIILMIVLGMIAGGIVSLIPIYLKTKLGANECVTGILLNFIFLKLSDYMLQNTALHKPGANTSMSVFYTVTISGVVLAVVGILLVVAYAFIMRKSTPGYRLRMVGNNPQFARFCGIDSVKTVLIAGIVSGMLASLISTGELLGIYKCFYYNYEDGMGFTAMTVALIGKQTTGGMIFGALLLGALQSGSIGLSITKGASPEIVIIVRGLVMLFGTVNIVKYFVRDHRRKEAAK